MTTSNIKSDGGGKSYEVKLGQPFGVELAENPTTGYRWAVHEPDRGIIEEVGHGFLPSPEAGTGGGGTCILTLRIHQKGEHHVRLKLWREWEGDNSTAKWFSFTIRAT